MTVQQSFLRYFLEHQNDLRAFIGSLVRDRSRRDDIFQDVALTLWQQFDRFDATRSFGAWARGVAANKILQAKRNDRRFPMPFSPEAIQNVLGAFAAEETNTSAPVQERGLQHCLSKLPEDGRTLLAMHYQQRLSGDEIAQASNRSVAAVYKQLSRLRQQLAQCIEGYVKQCQP